MLTDYIGDILAFKEELENSLTHDVLASQSVFV